MATRPPGRRVTTPPNRVPRRRTIDRAKVIFAVVGLVVILGLTLGGVLYDLRFSVSTEPGSQPGQGRAQANLIPTYEARLRENPNDYQAMIVLANILQNNGDYPNAIAWYDRAVQLKPDDVETRLAFGQALASYGQRFDAEVQYKKAIELDPKSARAEYYLGQLYEQWDPPRPEEAQIHYQRASQLEPEGTWGSAARTALQRLNATPTP